MARPGARLPNQPPGPAPGGLPVSAVLAALAVSAVLAVVVLAPLWRPRPAETPPAAGAAASATRPASPPTAPPPPTATSTPWPRRPRATAPPPEPTGTAVSAAPASAARPTAPAGRTATPFPTPHPTPRVTAAATPEPAEVYYLAVAGGGLEGWAGPGWAHDAGLLVNDGLTVQAQPWLAAPEPARVAGAYAVEAEVDVRGLALGVCEQSFDLVAAPADGGAALGGGLLYLCGGGGPLARITDPGDWRDGYNRDPALGSGPCELDAGWHAVRLEVTPGGVRLLVDGRLVAETAGAPVGAPAAGQVDVGLWSQGVALAVRRVRVEALPEDA
jgi:hypothetical protein